MTRASPPESRSGIASWMVVAAACAAFGAAWQLAHRFGIWLPNLGAALVAGGTSAWFLRSQLRELLTPTARDVIHGILIGIVASGGSWLLALPASSIVPGFAFEIGSLYAVLNSPPGPLAGLPVLAMAAISEELVFRGIVAARLRRHLGWVQSAAVSSTIYALPVALSGHWLLVAVALGLGSVWAVQFLRSGRLISPIISHLVWTLLVLVLFPIPS